MKDNHLCIQIVVDNSKLELLAYVWANDDVVISRSDKEYFVEYEVKLNSGGSDSDVYTPPR